MDHHHAALAFFNKITTCCCEDSSNYLKRESNRTTSRRYCNTDVIGNDERESRNDDIIWDQESENDEDDRYIISLCAALPVSSLLMVENQSNELSFVNSKNKNSSRWNHRGKYVKPDTDTTIVPAARTSRTSNMIISAPKRSGQLLILKESRATQEYTSSSSLSSY